MRYLRDLPTVAALGFALLAWAVLFGPAVPQLGTHFVGEEYVDHYGTQWFYWFTQESLIGGTTPDRAAAFFHPYGKDVYADTGSNVLDGIVAIPFRLLLGPVLGYNVFVMAGLLAGIVAMGGFVYDRTRDRGAAIFGATWFGLMPYGLVETAEGRPTQALLVVPVLFLWATWRAGARPGWGAPVAAGVLLAICGYQYWYYAFFGGVACLFHGLWRAAWPPPEAGGRVAILARHALIAALALGGTLPFAWTLALAGAEHPVVGRIDLTDWSLTANPPTTVEGFAVSLYTWQPLRGDVGSYVVDTDGHERFLSRAAAFPWAAIPLLLAWLVRPGRVDRGPVLAMLGGLALVGSGPVLLVGVWVLPNVAYHALIHTLPFLQRLWWAGRSLGFASAVVALACAGGLAAFARWGPRAQAALGWAIGLGWLLGLYADGLVPSVTWDATIPSGYRCLASGPPGAILELPFGWTQAHLYFQIAHQRPLFGGMLENNPTFTPEGTRTLIKKNGWVMAVNELSKRKPPEPWTEADKQVMRDLGYAYVVVQKDAFPITEDPDSMRDNDARVELRRWMRRLEPLAGPPVYDDARLTIYAPWGDPAPCDVPRWPKDAVAVGATERINVAGERNKDAQVLTRVFSASPSGSSPAGASR